MVKEITAYEDEFSGKIFKTFLEAKESETKPESKLKEKESEAKSQSKLEKKEIELFADKLAKKYGYKNWSKLLWYLYSNSFFIKNASVKFRIYTLAKRGVLSFSVNEIKSNLENVVIKALSYIEEDKEVTVRIILGKTKEIKNYKIKENDFDETKVTFKGFNPTIHYFGFTSKCNNEYFVYFFSYPTDEVDTIKILETLDKYKIKDCSEYMNIIQTDYIDGLTDEQIYYNLSNAGVDNWNGYDFAIELAEEAKKEWNSLSAVEKLSYLEASGVDNWNYYYEAKTSGFDYDNLNEKLQYKYFKDNEDLLAKEWKNYTKFKKELYGIK